MHLLPSQTPTAIIVDLANSNHESPTTDRRHSGIIDSQQPRFGSIVEHLQLPLFRGRRQRWHTSFGQYDNLASTAADDVPSTNAPESDDILNGSIFATLFDNCIPGVSQRCTADVLQPGRLADGFVMSEELLANVEGHRNDNIRLDEQLSVTHSNDDESTSRHDVCLPASRSDVIETDPVPSSNVRTLAEVGATSSCRNSSETASSTGTSGSASSSQRTVHYYYDHRLRPGGILSAARVARMWTLVCPPAYDEIVTAAADILAAAGSAAFCDDRPPPPPYVSSNSSIDEPPAYSDIVDGADHVIRRSSVIGINERTSPTSTCSDRCAPFNGRLAVRWNRNMRVERWGSSASWVTSS
jgi:hypothetical protein